MFNGWNAWHTVAMFGFTAMILCMGVFASGLESLAKAIHDWTISKYPKSEVETNEVQ